VTGEVCPPAPGQTADGRLPQRSMPETGSATNSRPEVRPTRPHLAVSTDIFGSHCGAQSSEGPRSNARRGLSGMLHNHRRVLHPMAINLQGHCRRAEPLAFRAFGTG
jgi:hypothetical protein